MKDPMPEQVYHDHEKMIWSIVHTRFRWAYANDQKQTMLRRPMDADDLFQEGCLGLIHAWDRYRESQGVKFSTFAYLVVSRFVAQYIIAHCRPIRVRPPADGSDYNEAQHRAMSCRLFSETTASDMTPDARRRYSDENPSSGCAHAEYLEIADRRETGDSLEVSEAVEILQEILTPIEMRILLDRAQGIKVSDVAKAHGLQNKHVSTLTREARERAALALRAMGY
jgi:RNA polymerase sigma factor (sigma-70 family)